LATRRFKCSVGEGEFAVVEEAGAAVNSDTVELTVELAATAVNIPGSLQRAANKSEVLDCLEKIKNHIIKANWPPA
jgi:hypothetical protein